MYNAVNSTIDAVRGEHDFAGGMAAAAISGAIFKSTGEFGLLRLKRYIASSVRELVADFLACIL
jgi:hypothetical protein